MPLKDLLKKKEKVANEEVVSAAADALEPSFPPSSEITFVRTDTNTEELIQPPSFDSDQELSPAPASKPSASPKKVLGRLRKSSSPPPDGETSPPKPQKEHRRISRRLHLGSLRRSASASSSNLPEDLPTISDAYSDQGDKQEKEAQWEDRATRLASRSPNTLAGASLSGDISHLNLSSPGVPTSSSPSRPRSVSDAKSDVNIQEAIRLHEAGQLEEATEMFRKLAESANVLSQVLYGLSLRHGWGCKPDPERAVTYLSAAASNSAEIESEALKAGMKKGGAAKGELVLAIFELANCYRYGWGVQVDKVAARQYYETAANLGDTDAMNEAAWCYLEGFGGKKDKVVSVRPSQFKAAQLLRRAEKEGVKTLGNTWIWKEKYDPN